MRTPVDNVAATNKAVVQITDGRCLGKSMALALFLDAINIVPAFVSPSPSGGLGFYWHGGRGGPKDVSVEIEPEDDDFLLTIEDDGHIVVCEWINMAERVAKRLEGVLRWPASAN